MNLEIPGGGRRVPYIQFDLDAKKMIPRIAKATGTHPGEVAWGLMELWEHVWTTKKDVVGEMVLDGCFGPNGRIRMALVEHGFIESVEAGWRVRGAEKHLFKTTAAERGKMGGKRTAEKGELLRNLKQHSPKHPPKQPPKQTAKNELATEAETEAHPTPNTQHLLKTTPARTRDEKPVGFLRDQIDAVFLASKGATYDWSFEDERAISPLQAKAGDVGDEEILRRWKIGLGLRFPITSKVSVLLRNWNECAKDQPAPVNPFPQKAGRATESDKDWSKKPKTYVSQFGEELDLEVCDG